MTIEEASQLLSNWIQQKAAEVAAQKAAVEHYGKLFRPENVAKLTQDQFKAFLLFKNNKHWAGIHRQSNVYADMDRLKAALLVLLDEAQPIQSRLDKITDDRWVLAFTLGVSLVNGLLAGLAPARPAMRFDPVETMRCE